MSEFMFCELQERKAVAETKFEQAWWFPPATRTWGWGRKMGMENKILSQRNKWTNTLHTWKKSRINPSRDSRWLPRCCFHVYFLIFLADSSWGAFWDIQDIVWENRRFTGDSWEEAARRIALLWAMFSFPEELSSLRKWNSRVHSILLPVKTHKPGVVVRIAWHSRGWGRRVKVEGQLGL